MSKKLTSKSSATPLPSGGELLKETARVFNTHFWNLIGIYSFPAVMIFVVSYFFNEQRDFLQNQSWHITHSPGHFILFLALTIALVLISAWQQAALLLTIRNRSHQPNLLFNYYDGFLKIPFLLYTGALAALAVVGGFFLLIIPGLLALVWFSQSILITIDKPLSGLAALRHSYALVRPRWMEVAGLLLTILLLLILISLPINAALQKFSWLQPPILSRGIPVVVDVIFTPFFACYSYLLYEKIKA